MNKEQMLGTLRATLTAVGAFLATWGFNDGNAWTPVVGVIVLLVSSTWGLLHHKDPNQPGTLQWSLVRKLGNAIGTACMTYGFLNPEKAESIGLLIAALGPIAALWFSWIANDPETPPQN